LLCWSHFTGYNAEQINLTCYNSFHNY
jgi:hypothetical protein